MKEAFKFFVSVVVLVGALINYGYAQTSTDATKPTLSPVLQEYFLKQIREWDRGVSVGRDVNGVFADIDFRTKIMPQISRAGATAFPIAPKVAEFMVDSEKHRYTLAYLVMNMIPTPVEDQTDTIISLADVGEGAQRLVAIAQLGRVSNKRGLEVLLKNINNSDLSVRLMSVVAIAFCGRSCPNEVAYALSVGLRDNDKDVRTASANGLRLMGEAAAPAVKELIAYLRTKENTFMAVRALKELPLTLVRPIRGDLENLVAEPKLTPMQKQEYVDLLMRIEMTPLQ